MSHRAKKSVRPFGVNPVIAAALLWGTVAVGLISYADALAAASANVTMTVRDVTSGSKPLAGVQIQIKAANGATCANAPGGLVTDTSGTARFLGCPVPDGVGSQSYMMERATKNGYGEDAGSPHRIGSATMQVAPGAEHSFTYQMRLRDTDGDGIHDINDACPAAAYRGGNGCPPASPPSGGGGSGAGGGGNTGAGGRPAAPAPAPSAATAAASLVQQTLGSDVTPPGMPQQFSAQVDPAGVQMAWQPATDNVGVDHYRLSRSTDQVNWEILSADIRTVSYADGGVEAGRHYFYRLQASDAAGNISEFAQIEIDAVDGERVITPEQAPSTAAQPDQSRSLADMVRFAGLGSLLLMFIILVFVTISRLRKRSYPARVRPASAAPPRLYPSSGPPHAAGQRGGISNFQPPEARLPDTSILPHREAAPPPSAPVPRPERSNPLDRLGDRR